MLISHISSQDGDLSCSSSSSSSPLQILPPPLYSFSLKAGEERTFLLAEKLDLGVGERGVIGRRVSVMARTAGGGVREGGRVVAEGVMGWN